MISKEEMVREIFKDINLRPVAKGMGRKYIGFELSEAYYNASLSRMMGSPYKVLPNDNPFNRKVHEDNKQDLW